MPSSSTTKKIRRQQKATMVKDDRFVDDEKNGGVHWVSEVGNRETSMCWRGAFFGSINRGEERERERETGI